MTDAPTQDVDFGTSTAVSGGWVDGYDGDVSESVTRSAVLVIAIAGQEALFDKIGEAETLQAVERYIKRVTRVSEAFGGRTVEIRHGEIVVDIEQPDIALQAAIEMQHRVAVLPPVSGVHLSLQIGFSYGAADEAGDSPSRAVIDTASTLAGMAEPGQIIACVHAQTALSEGIKARFDEYCLESRKARHAAHEPLSGVSSDSPSAVTIAVVPPARGDEPRRRGLMLKFDGNIYLLDDSNPVITIGRHEGNHVLLKGTQASRFHANIKRQGNKVVLTDTSTNGTFVSFNNAPPHLLLIKSECVLHGSGVISFSTSNPSSGIGTASAKFEVL